MATTNSSQSSSMPLPIFDGSDYDLWGKKMMTLFKSQNLTDIVEKGLNKPTNISILEEAQQKELETAEIEVIEVEAPYGAAMEGDWQSVIDYYREHFKKIDSPVTPSKDTVLHLAVQFKTEQPLKALLEILKERSLPEAFLKKGNKFGNTALHEATIYGKYEAVRLLVERCPELLSIQNDFGETPLFTAAGFSKTEIVEFLIRSKPGQCVHDDGLLLRIHRRRTVDYLSILSAAIIGQKFETALLLLELDKSLASLKDKNQISTLQLLAEMPAAFESGFTMGIFERLIYRCLPVKRHHEVKSQVQTWCLANKRDLESGRGRNSGDLGSVSKRNQRGGILKYLKVPEGIIELPLYIEIRSGSPMQ
ncbi:hypothetical protein NC653_026985 [Populus alba x Populus x berolinensis]|uniref:Ankyrin repeat family protein n=1 Tax=Populus alba x Populus x berolinensis TaxID=444605 RepID=A0AAD6Q4J0_9ROSI|nr:hypothetical protein NC653_026985 [Populus alba x Populus x berolinensis]